MEYLYVCHFSNGHIKVGRSINPQSRIANHAERVACFGVELVEHHIAECSGLVNPAELSLIKWCDEVSTSKHQNEWFTGVDYVEACQMADTFAAKKAAYERLYGWPDYIKEIQKHGLTQTQIGDLIGCSQPAIAKVLSGKTGEPSFGVGYGLLLIGRDLGIKDPEFIPTKATA